MKKMMALTLMGGMFLLAGCADGTVSTASGDTPSGSQFVNKGTISSHRVDYDVLEDKETGCYYLEGDRNLSPYYDETGNVKGCNRIME